MQSVFQEKYNNCVISAVLYNKFSLNEKERKLQQFMNDPERYDVFCDNVYALVQNEERNNEIDTLYLTIEGFSFISNSAMSPQTSCFPVLTMNKEFLKGSIDITKLIEIALFNFASYCEFIKI